MDFQEKEITDAWNGKPAEQSIKSRYSFEADFRRSDEFQYALEEL